MALFSVLIRVINALDTALIVRGKDHCLAESYAGLRASDSEPSMETTISSFHLQHDIRLTPAINGLWCPTLEALAGQVIWRESPIAVTG